MKIPEFGGEFALIRHLTEKGKLPDQLKQRIVKGVGDDCAVLRLSNDVNHADGGDRLILVTTDMLVDGDHFNRSWATPEQIGRKAMEANVSDIAAMGGRPLFAFISLALTDDIPVEFMEGLYRGMQRSCGEHGLAIVGGDTTHGKTFVINVALIGEVEPWNLCLRGHAKAGDLICVTGDLGKSWAGLELFLAGRQLDGNVSPFLEPRCRQDIAQVIAPHANAMIDVSDGLASEVRHICEESKCGAVVYRERIPLADHTRQTGELLGKDPYHWALSGGEDFELVFTIPTGRIPDIGGEVDYAVVGRILPGEDGIWLESEVPDDGESGLEKETEEGIEAGTGKKIEPDTGKTTDRKNRALRVPLPGGYDHFTRK